MRALSKNSYLFQTFTCLGLALVAINVGCGEPKPEPPNNGETTNTSEQTSTASTPTVRLRSTEDAQQLLTGVWLGKAVINEQRLQTLLTEKSQPQQEALFTEARTFLSTQMAMQFDSNGTMESAIEITPSGGQMIQGQTFAKWLVTAVEGNQITLETVEPDGSNQPITTQTVYTLSSDGNRIIMQANVGSDLSQCEPLVFLDRQIDTRIAEAPASGLVR